MALLSRFTRNKSQQPLEAKPKLGELTVGDYANAMPRIRLGEFVRSLFRQLRWAIPVFVLGVVGIWYITKDIERSYTGSGRLLVQLGSEYIYESATGSSGGNVMMTPDHIVLNEAGIMKNSDVIERVVGVMTSPGSFGPERFAKAGFKKISSAKTAQEEQNAWVSLYKSVDKSYTIAHQPKSSLVDLTYEHNDPEIAIATVNTFIDEYLKARKELFVDGSTDAIGERRRATQVQLDRNEALMFEFLLENGISDYDSERRGITARTEDLRTAINALRGDLTESEEALATAERQIRDTPELINQYVDDRPSQRIAQAELELKQLLAKYLPGSAPVLQKEAEIVQLKSLQSTNISDVRGGRRIGPNPVYQSIMTRRNELQSRVQSLREKEYTLQSQLDNADGKVKRLQSLSPTHQDLLRERQTLETRLSNYTAREQEALINRDQAEANSENVKVISYATRATKGSNKKLMAFVVGSAAWGFVLFIVGLMKVFLDPKLYVPGASSQGRTAGAFHDRRGESRGNDAEGASRRRSNGGGNRRADEQDAPPPGAVPMTMPYQAPAYAAYDPAMGYQEAQAYPQAGHVYQDGQVYAQPPSYADPQYAETTVPYTPGQETASYQETPYQETVHQDNAYQANPYQEAAQPEATPDAVYDFGQEPQAQQPVVQGNAALAVSSNPYLQAVPTEAETPLPILGTLPTQI